MEIYGKKACVLKREDSQSPDPHGQTIYRFYVPFWLNWNRIPGRARSGRRGSIPPRDRARRHCLRMTVNT